MEKTSDKEKKDEQGETNQTLTLSAALLAPLNSIFEAQVHSSRAFLNFLLQMGFRHRYSDAEVKKLEENKEENKATLDSIDFERKKKETIDQLLAKKKRGEALSPDELVELRQLQLEYGDLYQQCISYVDPLGTDRQIFIPNLALLPMKPLSIESATFNFELRVSDNSKDFKQMGTISGFEDSKRPWFLIQPKSVRGEFASSKESGTDKNIKIEVKVGTTEMPYGLHKLLSSLTDLAEDAEKTKQK